MDRNIIVFRNANANTFTKTELFDNAVVLTRPGLSCLVHRSVEQRMCGPIVFLRNMLESYLGIKCIFCMCHKASRSDAKTTLNTKTQIYSTLSCTHFISLSVYFYSISSLYLSLRTTRYASSKLQQIQSTYFRAPTRYYTQS